MTESLQASIDDKDNQEKQLISEKKTAKNEFQSIPLNSSEIIKRLIFSIIE